MRGYFKDLRLKNYLKFLFNLFLDVEFFRSEIRYLNSCEYNKISPLISVDRLIDHFKRIVCYLSIYSSNSLFTFLSPYLHHAVNDYWSSYNFYIYVHQWANSSESIVLCVRFFVINIITYLSLLTTPNSNSLL